MRWIKISKSREDKFVTDFMYEDRAWHTVTSYVWIPTDDIIIDWVDLGRHPAFTYV